MSDAGYTVDDLDDPEIVAMQVEAGSLFALRRVPLSLVAPLSRDQWEKEEGHGNWIDELAALYRSGQSIPPIVLAPVGEGFEILDGGHRASGAAHAGLVAIDAFVLAGEGHGTLPEEDDFVLHVFEPLP